VPSVSASHFLRGEQSLQKVGLHSGGATAKQGLQKKGLQSKEVRLLNKVYKKRPSFKG
jgi:hypothetical protein